MAAGVAALVEALTAAGIHTTGSRDHARDGYCSLRLPDPAETERLLTVVAPRGSALHDHVTERWRYTALPEDIGLDEGPVWELVIRVELPAADVHLVLDQLRYGSHDQA